MIYRLKIRKWFAFALLVTLLFVTVGPATMGLQLQPRLRVDVFLIVDQTGSFDDDNAAFKMQSESLIGGLLNTPNLDVRVGLGIFRDYPVADFGDTGDFAFFRLQDLTANTAFVTNAIDRLVADGGNDLPEAQCAALYQAAVGAGQDTNNDGDFDDPEDIPFGQNANFRADAVKFFILWTDAPFHSGGDVGSARPYPTPAPGLINPTPGQVDCTRPSNVNPVIALLGQRNIRVVGIGSSDALPSLEAVAQQTLTFAPDGGVDCNGDGLIEVLPNEPFVCPISPDGKGISEALKSIVGVAGQTRELTLEEAINQQGLLVEAFTKAKGPAGDIVGLRITNNLGEEVAVTVNRGARFIDPNNGQTYVASRTIKFFVDSGRTRQFNGQDAIRLFEEKGQSSAGSTLSVISNVAFVLSESWAEVKKVLAEIVEQDLSVEEGLNRVQSLTSSENFPRPQVPACARVNSTCVGISSNERVRAPVLSGTLQVVIAIDNSGSMRQFGRIEAAKKAAINFLGELERQALESGLSHQAALVVWNDQIDSRFSHPLTDDFRTLIEKVDAITTAGLTNFDTGLSEAVRVVSASPSDNATKVVVFLTDAASLGEFTPRTISDAVNKNIRVCTIGLGIAPGNRNIVALQDVASKTGCRFLSSPTSGELEGLFNLLISGKE